MQVKAIPVIIAGTIFIAIAILAGTQVIGDAQDSFDCSTSDCQVAENAVTRNVFLALLITGFGLLILGVVYLFQ